jgi:S-formylglutathione hydrolase FrmB
MALLRLEHVPETVQVNLPLYLILPDPGRLAGRPLQRRKVLYLLHGLSDDASAWQRYTSVEVLAARYGLVVVMPSAGRSFYTDQPNGQAYFTYLTRELPEYLAGVFGLDPAREDTLIAGNSMGGYGAYKAAFAQPGRFAAAASFSGALSVEILRAFHNDPRRAEFTHIFGDLDRLAGTPHDPAVWFREAAVDPAALPRLYLSVGRLEDMYPINRQAQAVLKRLGIPVDYHEEDAQHDWIFWDREIRRFLAAELGPLPDA